MQPYVLRSWEAEFPDMGVTKTEGGPRVYRRADLEFVLRIKHLLFVEGLTLAGARKKLLEESARVEAPATVQELDELLGSDARERILQVKRGLREIATILAKAPSRGAAGAQSLFDIAPAARRGTSKKVAKAPPPKRAVKVIAKKKKK